MATAGGGQLSGDYCLSTLGPDFADVFERRKPSQGLQPARVIVGVDEVSEAPPGLVVVVIVVALHGRLLDGSVHPLDLAVRPGMFRFRQATLDAVALQTAVQA
jgi:hypothetical protein